MSTPSTQVRSAAQIRREFLDFFTERHAHTLVPSSPVVPRDDPTLLFANAGMNQFKDVFLGQADRPYRRAVNSQKCIRAGGKHNDLEDVGRDTYHHTFFEMLGNWSFGDYFKAEAIEWAWELLTQVWGLEPDRLYVTVFAGDDRDGLVADTEAEEHWRRFVPAERVSRWGVADNFWEMGERGPCGPCSEISYDGRPEEERRAVPGAELVNRDHPLVTEIWNLVFIQFDRGEGGVLTPLPARHVDTGMGLERIVRVLQGRASNYDTDLWTPIFRAIESQTGGRPYGGRPDEPVDLAYRVIADHVRCLTVALADGARPGNEGRAYVLRRILRRAVRHAHHTLHTTGAWVHRLVPAVIESLGGAFPEIAPAADRVAAVIRDEEESFLRTLDRGIALFDEAARRAEADHLPADGAERPCLGADDAFKLHDTFGFPIDLTRVMARERGMTVDETGYETMMDEARRRSRHATTAVESVVLPPEAIARLRHLGVKPTRDDDKYHGRPVSTKVAAIWNGRDFDNVSHVGDEVAVILNRTNHYAEAGGQVGDHGTIMTDVVDMGTLPVRGFSGREPSGDAVFSVKETVAVGGFVLHVGRVTTGALRTGDRAIATIDRKRREPVLANHTGTHLLNHALREVMGDDVEQRGSLVAPDRLRFDFSCSRAMTDVEIERVESLVNESIGRDLAVDADVVPLAEAKRMHGLRAVFGERYPDPVRVVSIGQPVARLRENPADAAWGQYSIELCGGTHLARTGLGGSFTIVQEEALAAGVRRVVAVTGPAAAAALLAGRDLAERTERAEGLEGAELARAHDDLARLADEMTIPAAARHRIKGRLESLRGRIKTARRSLRSEARAGAVEQARAIATDSEGRTVIVASIEGADQEALRSAIDVLKSRCPEAAVMLIAPDQERGKVAMVAVVPPVLVARGLRAGDWVRQAARPCGGSGGGRPEMAQAGGKDPSKVQDAAAIARRFAEEVLS